MTLDAVYKGQLREHFRAPRHHGDLTGCEHVARVDNPLCGDELEVGVHVVEGRVVAARFRARACSVCMASGSLMTEAVEGAEVAVLPVMLDALDGWFDREADGVPEGLPAVLAPLAVVRRLPTRRRCVTLPWEGLVSATHSPGGGED